MKHQPPVKNPPLHALGRGDLAVTVTDGRLTVRSAGGSTNNKLCFVEDHEAVKETEQLGGGRGARRRPPQITVSIRPEF